MRGLPPSEGVGVSGWFCAGWFLRCTVVGSPSPVPCVESARGGVAGGTAGECACPAWGEWCGSPAPCAGGLHNIALQCIPPDSPAHWGGFRTADGSRPVCPGAGLWYLHPVLRAARKVVGSLVQRQNNTPGAVRCAGGALAGTVLRPLALLLEGDVWCCGDALLARLGAEGAGRLGILWPTLGGDPLRL